MRRYAQSQAFTDHYQELPDQLNEEELLERQQERFVTQGGIREQMLHARLNYRGK